jgi:ketosteroid isomerase-like protein
MTDQGKDSTEALQEAIDRYNAAWNDHDLDAIMALHASDMVSRQPHGG